MRILVAEDDPISRRVLEKVLSEWGHDVTACGTGVEAWAAFRKRPYPIVISDWMMPGLDGVDLVRQIREHPTDQYVYTIMLTSRSETADLVKGFDAGVDDYLKKPLDVEELRARMRAADRIIELERRLAEQFAALQAANHEVVSVNRRMQRDLEAAARIQQALLPTMLPRFPGVEFTWQFSPCHELAGDILNVFPLDDRHVAFYVLDVSGHGVQAALLSVSLSRVLVPTADQSSLLVRQRGEELVIVPPAVMARRLNRRFLTMPNTAQFFTMLYGVLDVVDREARYVCAGHPGPIFAPRGGRPQLLPATGPPLGIRDGIPYEQKTIRLEEGDRLLVYSDGVTEARNRAGEFFGTEQLLDVVHEQCGGGVADCVNALMERLAGWHDGLDAQDDISCLALQVEAANDSAGAD